MRQYLKSVTPAYWDAKERAAKVRQEREAGDYEAYRTILQKHCAPDAGRLPVDHDVACRLGLWARSP